MKTTLLKGLFISIAAGCFLTGVKCVMNTASTETSSETTNGFTASVTHSDGTSAAGALVKLIDRDTWLEKTIAGERVATDSAYVDAEGEVTLSEIDTTCHYYLQVDSDIDGAFFGNDDVVSLMKKEMATLILRPYASFSGHISSPAGTIVKMNIAGTTYESKPGDDGAFVFEKLSAGKFSLLVEIANGADTNRVFHSTLEFVSSEEIVDTLVVGRDLLLVDNFDNGFDSPAFGSFTDVNWFIYPLAAPRDTLASIVIQTVEAGGYLDKSFSSTVILKNVSEAVKGVGCQLVSEDDSTFDFSGLTKVSFAAKGRGNVRMSLESHFVDTSSILIASDEQFGYLFTLTPEWKLYSIPVDSLSAPSYTQLYKLGIPWSAAAPSLQRMEFEVSAKYNSPGDTILFSLDEIYLEGNGMIRR